MKILISLLAALACLGQAAAQPEKPEPKPPEKKPAENDKLLAKVKDQGQQYLDWFVRGEFDKMADRTPAPVIEASGGRKDFLAQQRFNLEQFGRRKLKILAAEAQVPALAHQPKEKDKDKDIIVFVPTVMRLEGQDGKLRRLDHLIAVSADQGKTWSFVERGSWSDADLRDFFPQLPKTVALPPDESWEVEDATPGVFTFARGNFQLAIPKGWKKLPATKDYQLILEQAGQTISVDSEERGLDAEQAVQEVANKFKTFATSVKEVRRDTPKVAGAPAILVRLEVERVDKNLDLWITAFQHQGISYRIVGAGTLGKAPTLETDYQAALKGFSFLADRKDWLAVNAGKPVRTAFMAGLASVELKRPRWREITFDQPFVPGPLEEMRFQFHSGGAWINFWAYDQKPGASVKTELEELQQYYAPRLQGLQAKRVLLKGAKGLMPALEMTGISGLNKFVVLGAVFVKKGVVVHASLECIASSAAQFQDDWTQLVRDIRLEDPDSLPPLYALRDRDEFRAPDPALTALLKKATVVFPDSRLHQVHSISPDGQQALVQGLDGWGVENLGDRKRSRLLDAPNFGVAAAWSRDGKKIAYPTHRGVRVQSADAKIGAGTIVPFRAQTLAFLPDQRLLMAGTPQKEGQDPLYPPRAPINRFQQHQLVRLEEDAVEPDTLLEFPLARFAHLAVSPDSKQLALVTNKDAPRTSHRPGHLYVGALDGTGLRQLTKETESIRSVAWSEDGRSLYVVRRLGAESNDFRAGDFRAGDLYRVSVENGAAVNLSRCNKIDQAWVQGDHFLLRISTFEVPQSQTGIFKIAQEDLERAAAALPEPKPAGGGDRVQAVARKIKAALAPRRLQEIVPTPEIMEELARVFAAAASAELGHAFDFSAASLDRLPFWAEGLEQEWASEPALVFGLGAYYGETLRKQAGAEWRLQPLPLGEWLPGRSPLGNSVAQVLLPFSEVYRYSLGGDRDYMRGEDLPRQRAHKILLVYPPAAAKKVLEEATPKDYREARAALDKGELKAALALYGKELARQPRNAVLALEALDLAEIARMPAQADQIARQAVENGSEVPELLLRHAGVVAKTDPAQALSCYRKAALRPYVSADTLIKLGKHLAATGQQAQADSCFRRAHRYGSDLERNQIRQLMGMPPGFNRFPPKYDDDFFP